MKRKKNKIHVKQGDYVQIISGTDKGKTGKITKIIYKKQQVIVENINLKTKHIQPKQEKDTGRITQIEGSIHCSNVMLYSTNEKIASRFRYKRNNNNKKQRILIKNNEIIK
uniref:ribosomal protein L24 n=1 Tax=Hypnea nidulans TaxID=673449 RepID=UPI0027DA67AA|nr:ribosomal protein L24 [Hypnea nidulans]WCH54580.1 ribosomal protein L24 [Hypnea nidulans]